jgi:2-polyprenyl-3-methyl-5-hydroxy-6-metoxy-1,4-benzoquinol methylase
VACGTGWASIAMAHTYPKITVDGVDLDQDAISAARRNAEQDGVADRVRFSVTDAADLGGAGGYDLLTIFEALHDMSRPIDALRAARQMLSDDGTLPASSVRPPGRLQRGRGSPDTHRLLALLPPAAVKRRRRRSPAAITALVMLQPRGKADCSGVTAARGPAGE